jgi:SOS-response transcriptional repressor LexA
MTDRAQLVLDFIKAYIKLHQAPPSYEAIAKAMGLKSRSNICRIVHSLEREGHLSRKPRKFHSIRVMDKSVRDIVSL